MRFATETLTPERAKELLLNQIKNRPPNKSKVAELARQIRAGQWRLTHQSIGITTNGKMYDGQHRCLAVIETGIAILCSFAYGCDESNFAYLDLGEKRTAGDLLGTKGYHSPKNLAALGRQVVLYNQGRIAGNQTVAPAEIEAFVDGNKERLEESLTRAMRVKTYPCLLGALHFIYSSLPLSNAKELADSFLAGMAEGTNLQKYSGVWRLREILLNRGKGDRYYHSDVLAWAFKAMNAHFNGEQFRYLPRANETENRYKVDVKALRGKTYEVEFSRPPLAAAFAAARAV